MFITRKKFNKIISEAARHTENEIMLVLNKINTEGADKPVSRSTYEAYLQTMNKFIENIYKELNK